MRKILLACLLVAGCSKTSDQIAPAPVAGNPYQGLGCNELKRERVDIEETLYQARRLQNKRAGTDFTTVALIGIPLSGLDGSQDQEQAIANMRGQIIAIDSQASNQSCADPVFGSEEREVVIEGPGARELSKRKE